MKSVCLYFGAVGLALLLSWTFYLYLLRPSPSTGDQLPSQSPGESTYSSTNSPPATTKAVSTPTRLKDQTSPNPTTVPPDVLTKLAEFQAMELDPKKQKRIWDLEHITFELEWKFGKVFKEALTKRDSTGLEKCFHPSFVGQLPSSNEWSETVGDWWQQKGRDFGEQEVSQKPAKAIDVTHYLIDYLSDFDELKSVKLRVLDIREQVSSEGITDYQLKLYLTASGMTGQLEPISLTSTHRVLGRFSSDEEIAQAQIIVQWEILSEHIQHASQTFMQDLTTEMKLDQVALRDNWRQGAQDKQAGPLAMQVAAADFDCDGYLDLAISTMYGVQHLLRMIDGTHFEEVTYRMGLPKSRRRPNKGLASWIDYDNDGFPDLLLGDSLYRNFAGKRFVEVTETSGLKLEHPTLGCIVGDYDCDGLLDIYVLHDSGGGKHTVGFVGDETSAGAPNRLWHNLGDGRFEEVSESAGVAGASRQTYAAAWLFANDDHYPDLYVVNDFGKNLLYLNDGQGHFVDITDESHVGDFANSMGIAVGDINGDGDVEIYVANMFSKMGKRIVSHVSNDDYPPGVYQAIQGACTGNHLYQLSEDRKSYDEISHKLDVNQVGWAFAPAFLDLDADGYLDIYATTGFISRERGKPDG